MINRNQLALCMLTLSLQISWESDCRNVGMPASQQKLPAFRTSSVLAPVPALGARPNLTRVLVNGDPL